MVPNISCVNWLSWDNPSSWQLIHEVFPVSSNNSGHIVPLGNHRISVLHEDIDTAPVFTDSNEPSLCIIDYICDSFIFRLMLSRRMAWFWPCIGWFRSTKFTGFDSGIALTWEQVVAHMRRPR